MFEDGEIDGFSEHVLGAELQPLLVDLGVVLAEERRRPDLGLRFGKLHGIAGQRELAPARMLDRLHHLAGLQVRVGQYFVRREARAGRHAGRAQLVHHLVLGPRRRPALDERVDLVLVGRAPLRIRPLRIADEIRAADDAQQRVPHVRANGLGVDVRVVVGAPGLAVIDPRGRSVGNLVPAAGLEIAAGIREAHGDAAEIDHRVLHGQLHALALPRSLPLPQGGHHPEGRVHSGAGIPDGRSRLERR